MASAARWNVSPAILGSQVETAFSNGENVSHTDVDNFARDIAVVGPTAATPVFNSFDMATGVTESISKLADPNFWRRVGFGALGIGVIIAGVYMLLEKDANGVVRTLHVEK